MTRDLTVEQHSTQNGLALNCHTKTAQHQTPLIHQRRCTSCLTSPLPSKWIFLYSLMSACHNLRSHSPLKTVLNKLGDSYQTYVNTYKTCTIVTCHADTDNPWIGILLNMHRTLIFQTITIMRTWIILRMQNRRTIPSWKPLHSRPRWFTPHSSGRQRSTHGSHQSHRMHELHRLSLALPSSAPPERHDDVHTDLMLYPWADNLCEHSDSGLATFNGSDSTQLGLVSGYWNCSQSDWSK